MKKIKFIYTCFVVILSISNLNSQDTIKLDEIGKSQLAKVLGTKYFQLKSKNISLLLLKPLEQLIKNKINSATIAEINSVKLRSSATFAPIFILTIECDSNFIIFESLRSDDFKNAKQLFKSNYLNEYPDQQIRIITNDYNYIDIYLNYHNDIEDFDSNLSTNILLKFYVNQLKYASFQYEPNKFIYIGLKDTNDDGKLDVGTDYFFCDRANSNYFFTEGTNKTCKVISKNNYLKIDSAHIYKITFFRNKTDIIILEKIKEIKANFYDKTICLFYCAPFQLTYDSVNAKNLKISDLFTKNKYVYIDIGAEFCNQCLRNLPELDNMSKTYNNDLIILTLFDRDDDRKELQGLIKQKNVKHSIGWSNNKINDELLLSGYPHGVLFDKTGKVVDFMTLDELTKFCNDTFSK